MNKKTLLWTAIFALVLASGVVAYVFFTRQSSTTTDTKPQGVSVKGLDSTPTPLSDTTKAMVKDYVTTTLNTKHGEGTYTGVVRENSYKRIVTPQGGIVTTLLVDVTETNETYMFTRTGTDTSQYGTSYLRCASESDQKVHPSVCKDIAND